MQLSAVREDLAVDQTGRLEGALRAREELTKRTEATANSALSLDVVSCTTWCHHELNDIPNIIFLVEA